MPHIGVTVYDLLLSCPGDVLDLKETIDACVKSFNSSIGEANNIRIDLKHWSTDSYTQSGDKPQNILNRQFVLDCDLCIALLGIRFGTPTDNYDSGTEEEIEKMLEQGKQVFLYFVERNVDPSKIDLKQYKKVKDFKEKYSDKGMYTVVKSAEDLRSDFQNALSLYFIKLIAPNTVQFQSSLAPKLIITAGNNEGTSITPFHTNYQNVKYVKDKEIAIKELIEIISSMEITQSIEESFDEHESEIPYEELQEMPVGDILKMSEEKRISTNQFHLLMGTKPPEYEKVEIDETQRNLVSGFCKKHGINVNRDFYFLGNLQREIVFTLMPALGNSSSSYLGSEAEKEKYELLKDLISRLYEYNHVIEFFGSIDSMPCVALKIENQGNTFDEDIDVKLFIEQKCYANIDHIPKPDVYFLEEAVNLEMPKTIFCDHRDADAEDYSNYPVSPYIPQMPPVLFKSKDEKVSEQREKYQEMMEYVFCYDFRKTDKDDVLCFNVPYLKQNTKMFFPSYLFFTKIPKNLRYEMRSKHSPDVYKGVLEINTGE